MLLRCIECASKMPIDGVRMHITIVRIYKPHSNVLGTTQQ